MLLCFAELCLLSLDFSSEHSRGSVRTPRPATSQYLNFEPQAAQKPDIAPPKLSNPTVKTMPWGQFRAPGHPAAHKSSQTNKSAKTMPWEQSRAPGRPEARQSSQTINFDCQNHALGAISSPRASRSPPELRNRQFWYPIYVKNLIFKLYVFWIPDFKVGAQYMYFLYTYIGYQHCRIGGQYIYF